MIALSVLMAFTFFVREGVRRSFRFFPTSISMEKSVILLFTTEICFLKPNWNRRIVNALLIILGRQCDILEKDDVIDLTQSPQLLPEVAGVAFWLPPEF